MLMSVRGIPPLRNETCARMGHPPVSAVAVKTNQIPLTLAWSANRKLAEFLVRFGIRISRSNRRSFVAPLLQDDSDVVGIRSRKSRHWSHGRQWGNYQFSGLVWRLRCQKQLQILPRCARLDDSAVIRKGIENRLAGLWSANIQMAALNPKRLISIMADHPPAILQILTFDLQDRTAGNVALKICSRYRARRKATRSDSS